MFAIINPLHRMQFHIADVQSLPAVWTFLVVLSSIPYEKNTEVRASPGVLMQKPHAHCVRLIVVWAKAG